MPRFLNMDEFGIMANGAGLAIIDSMVDVAEYHTKMSSQGRLVLPAGLRKALGLHAGDTLSLSLDQDGVVRMVTARQLADNLWSAYADEAPAGTAAAQLRELRDADVALAEAKHGAISARRAAVDRSEGELEAELLADLGLGEPA